MSKSRSSRSSSSHSSSYRNGELVSTTSSVTKDGVTTSRTDSFTSYGVSAGSALKNGVSLLKLVFMLILTVSIIRIMTSANGVDLQGFVDFIKTCPQVPDDWMHWTFYDFTTSFPDWLNWAAHIFNILGRIWSLLLYWVVLCWNVWTFVIWLLVWFLGF